MKISTLDHFVLTVKNIPTTVNFYCQALGMEKITFAENRIALLFGKHKINLHQAGKEFEPKAKHVQTGSADLCFITNTPINDVVEHLRKNEVSIIEGPVTRTGAQGSIQSIYCRDPDGNLIEISNY